MVQKQRPQERKLKLSLQQNIFVMFFLFRTCGCGKNVNSEEETVVAILQSLMEKSYRVWWKNLTGPDGKILHGRKEASKLWRNWRRAEKNLVSRKGRKTDWIKGRHKKLCQAFEREAFEWQPFCFGKSESDRDGDLHGADSDAPPAGKKLDRPRGRWWKQPWLASPHGHRSTFKKMRKIV